MVTELISYGRGFLLRARNPLVSPRICLILSSYLLLATLVYRDSMLRSKYNAQPHSPLAEADTVADNVATRVLLVSSDVIHSLLEPCRLEVNRELMGCQCGYIRYLSLFPPIWSGHRAFPFKG